MQGIKYWIWSPLAVREAAAEVVASPTTPARATSAELVFKHGRPLTSDDPPIPPSVFLPEASATSAAGTANASTSGDGEKAEKHASLPRQLLRHIMSRPSLDFKVRHSPPGRPLRDLLFASAIAQHLAHQKVWSLRYLLVLTGIQKICAEAEQPRGQVD